MPSSTSYGRDRGLQARMAITLVLLGGLYVLLIAVLVAAGIGGVAVAVIAALLFLAQYFTCDRIALAALGAREVSAPEAPRMHAILERLCVAAGTPMPRLAVVETTMPNAFAVGRSPANSTVGATRGLLEQLDDAQLEAVLAHELAHVAHRDAMVMTIAGFFAAIAAVLARVGRGAGRRAGDEHGPGFFLVVIASGLVYVVSYVLVQALSRHRELVADRDAARLTGAPAALSAALARISDELAGLPQRELRAACGELAMLYIVVPDVAATVATLFSTHPPLTVRCAALARLPTERPAIAG